MSTTKDLVITVPYYVGLRKASSWNRSSDDDHGFHVVRFHYHLRRKKELGRLFDGPPIADISVVKGVVRNDVEEQSLDVDVTEQETTARKLLSENEGVAELAAEIGVTPHLLLKSSLRTDLKDRWLNRICEEVTATNAHTVSRHVTFRTDLTVDGNQVAGDVLIVSSYRRVEYDIYLVAVDHLRVSYRRANGQIRRRRVKEPEWVPIDPRSTPKQGPPNKIDKLNWPLKTISFWELVPHRSPVRHAGYTVDVGRPFQVTAAPLSTAITHRLPTEEVPSLYELANSAFPPKWKAEVTGESQTA